MLGLGDKVLVLLVVVVVLLSWRMRLGRGGVAGFCLFVAAADFVKCIRLGCEGGGLEVGVGGAGTVF